MHRKNQNREYLIIFPLKDLSSSPGQFIQLLPYGQVKTDKGEFLVDDAAMEAIIRAFRVKVNEVVVDYEHQTLEGVIAPAAGWITALDNRGQDGLWAEASWTQKAQDFINNREYRYLSPVVQVRQSDGRAVFLHSVGLTNTPAIDGMHPLANKIGAAAPEEDMNMELLKKLAALMGLPETATEEEIIQAVTALAKAGQMVANKEVLGLLDLTEAATLAETKGKIIALKNPSGYVKAEEFKALQDKLAERDRDELVSLALKSGKVAPASAAWAKEYALKDPVGFKSFLDHAPVVVPVGTEVAGGADQKRQTVSDDLQISINKAMGLSDEDFKKYGGE